MNKVFLVGRLGADPEIRHSQSGTAIANMNVATDRSVKRGDTWEKETDWHRVVVFGRRAEFCQNHLAKGCRVSVEGRLQTRKWEDQNGNTRYTTEVVVDNIEPIDWADGGSHQGEGRNTQPKQGSGGYDDDDVPF